ncbi:MAG: hypothetical protein VB141_10420 [Burkholderia gladioli]
MIGLRKDGSTSIWFSASSGAGVPAGASMATASSSRFGSGLFCSRSSVSAAARSPSRTARTRCRSCADTLSRIGRAGSFAAFFASGSFRAGACVRLTWVPTAPG